MSSAFQSEGESSPSKLKSVQFSENEPTCKQRRSRGIVGMSMAAKDMLLSKQTKETQNLRVDKTKFLPLFVCRFAGILGSYSSSLPHEWSRTGPAAAPSVQQLDFAAPSAEPALRCRFRFVRSELPSTFCCEGTGTQLGKPVGTTFNYGIPYHSKQRR